MVCLDDHGEAIALQSFDDPQLPEGTSTVELLRHDARRQAFELLIVPGPRQACVPHVVVDVEAIVVDPHRFAQQRGEGKPLTVAWNPVQPRSDVSTESIDIDAASSSKQG